MGKHDGRRWALGALVLGFIGFVAGILTAPKSGKETRDDLKKAAGSAKREAEKQLKEVHTELKQLSSKVKKVVTGKSKDAKKEVDMLLKRASEAQVKVKTILSSIHEGTADDPELNAALKEASAAKDHLKKFLAKKTK